MSERLALQFSIPGEPVGQPRPRIFRGGGRKSDSAASAAWKAAAKEIFALRLEEFHLPSPLFPSGPVALALVAYFPLPAGEHRKRAPRPERWHVARPDVDNALKTTMDAAAPRALQRPKGARTAAGTARRLAKYEQATREAARGLLWRDDSQVCAVHAYKICAAQGQKAGVDMLVSSLGPLVCDFPFACIGEVVNASYGWQYGRPFPKGDEPR